MPEITSHDRKVFYQTLDCPNHMTLKYGHICKAKEGVCADVILAGNCPMQKTITRAIHVPSKKSNSARLDALEARVDRLERWNL